MRLSHLRSAVLLGVLTALALVLPIASASALVPYSEITTPSGTTFPFVDSTIESGGTITIAGNADLTEVEIRCYYGPGISEYGEVTPYKEPIAVSGGTFSTIVEANKLYKGRCVLRAVPVEYKEAGEPSSFSGPTIVPSSFSLSHNTEFYAVSSTLAGSIELAPAGEYSLESNLYSAITKNLRTGFWGEADLGAFAENEGKTSRVVVDGQNAYLPTGPKEIESTLSGEAKTTVEVKGGLPTTVTKSFNPSTHQLTVHEEDPLAKCAGSNEFPPTYAGKGCESVVGVGVTLDRTWETSEEDHVVTLVESWHSTDGATHTVSVRSLNELLNAEKENAAFEFPGATSFTVTHTGEAKTVPAGPGAIYYKSSTTTPEEGDDINPILAIVYDTAPSGAIQIQRGSNEPHENQFDFPYQLTIPAGGSRTLRTTYVQGFGVAEVQKRAAEAQARYAPSVAITSPATGTTSTTASVTVSGTASDTGALTGLTVNGQAVTVASNGTWTTSVPLSPGANTITAKATDEAGLTSSAATAVTYTPPPPPPHASEVGTVSGAGGKVTLALTCTGPAGSFCHVQISLTSIEKLRHGKVIAVAAKAKTRSKKITVGGLSLTIAAGSKVKVTISLNATGRRLLAHFHRLPAHLSTTLTGASPAVVIAQNLTITPPRKKKHKR
jgi:hypothetical protein